MSDLTTYTGLQEAIVDYLGRDDLVDRVPTFIRLAEIRMNRELRLKEMEHRAYTLVSAGNYQIPLPAKRVLGDWDVFIDMRDLVWIPDSNGKTTNLQYATPDEYAVEIRKVGIPRSFTIAGGSDLFLLPSPEGSGTLQLTYYAEIPPLCEVQEDNQVLLHHPDLYLYGALVESAPWTRGSAPVDMWEGFLKEAARSIKMAEQTARFPKNIKMKPNRGI